MTYQFRQARAAALVRAREPGDRRHYHRFTEFGMVARLGAQLLDVHDLSIGGLRVPHSEVPLGQPITLHLIPREGRKLLLPETMLAKVEIINQCDSWTRLRFVGMTFTLAKFLVRHLARRHGVDPYLVK